MLKTNFSETAYVDYKKAMMILKKTGWIFLSILGLLFVSFFVYANLKPPTLGEKLYMAHPTQIVVMLVPEKMNMADSASLIQHIKKEAFVSSAILNRTSHILCVTFDPARVNRQEMIHNIQAFDSNITERIITNPGPQCPVDGALYTIAKFKYALNLRK
ncbi:MAG: hypothetical protein JSS67_10100 [Bacteroidetes bacterium]|nr:hypothetical protein [Bacteroidota bacterium]